LRLGSTPDALDVAGRLRLHQVVSWCNLVAASAAGGVPFYEENSGLWLSVLILVGNATLVVSKHVYV
jgi:hypothetical protein